MTPHETRQPGLKPPAKGLTPFRRLLLIIGMVVTLGVGGYSLFLRWSHDRVEADNELASELQGGRLVENSEPLDSPRDWPQWRGPLRDGVSLETGLNFSWPEEGPKMLWEAEASEGYSGFAVTAGRVDMFVQQGNDEAVVGWDAETGHELWRVHYPAHFTNRFGSGPRSTPTIDGGRVYTVGGTGVFLCLDAATGEQFWRHDLLQEFDATNLTWGVAFSPLIEGKLVLTNPGGKQGNSIVAFDKISGEVVWRALSDTASYSSPIAVTAANR